MFRVTNIRNIFYTYIFDQFLNQISELLLCEINVRDIFKMVHYFLFSLHH